MPKLANETKLSAQGISRGGESSLAPSALDSS